MRHNHPTALEAADSAGYGADQRAEAGRPEVRPYPLTAFADVEVPTDSGDFVEGLLIDGQLSVLRAPSNTGKTFLATDLGFHVALGKPWFGRDIEQGAVVYVACEGGKGINMRIAAFRQHHGLAGVIVPFFVLAETVDLGPNSAGLDRLLKTVSGLRDQRIIVRLIVIDTLARALGAADENSSEAMGAFTLNADRIRNATGAHVLTIHHTGKDEGRGSRGHNSLLCNIDTELAITREPGTKVSTVSVTKQRDLEASADFAFSLLVETIGIDRRGNPITSNIVQPVADDQAPKRKPHLSPKNRDALDKLHDLLVRAGQPAPMDSHYPAGAVVVTLDQWRQHLKDAGVISGEANGIRNQWKRIADTLRETGLIGVWQELVWSTSTLRGASP